jgi:lipoyl(octanoyl) transferase
MEAAASVSASGVRRLRLVRLGRTAYADALRLQRGAAQEARAGGPETLFLLEHDPVFTLGRNASAADVLLSAEELARRGIAVCESDRGGKVTYHGPGQLVGYPVVNLHPDRRDVKRYVTDLEEVLLRALASFGIRGERSNRPERVSSVWIGDDKIAAIGVHIARWVTTHGFALNVSDAALANFGGIVPCGITDGGVTSMERVLGRRPDPEAVAGALADSFAAVFSREIIAA